MPKSNVSKQMTLNFLCRNQSVIQPTQLYLALYSTNPTDADVGTKDKQSHSAHLRFREEVLSFKIQRRFNLQ